LGYPVLVKVRKNARGIEGREFEKTVPNSFQKLGKREKKADQKHLWWVPKSLELGHSLQSLVPWDVLLLFAVLLCGHVRHEGGLLTCPSMPRYDVGVPALNRGMNG